MRLRKGERRQWRALIKSWEHLTVNALWRARRLRKIAREYPREKQEVLI